jgi:ELWxxDGT repeat protein
VGLAAAGLALFLSAPSSHASPEISLVANIGKKLSGVGYPSDYLPSARVLPVQAGKWVFVSGADRGSGELWVTDGTPAETRQLADLCLGPCGHQLELLASDGKRAVFTVESETDTAVRGLWSTDGTLAGTLLLKSFERSEGRFQYLGAVPGGAQGFVLCENGCGLWQTDGTVGGTRRRVGLGPADAVVLDGHRIGSRSLVVLTTAAGGQLWVSDGSAAGTRQLAKVRVGNEAAWEVAGSKFFFTADDGRVWVSDGTAGGTKRLHAEVTPHGRYAAVGSSVCFSGFQVQTGFDLWCSEGTPSSTRMWAKFPYFEALRPGEELPLQVVALKGRRYFRATDGLSEATLWSTDGVRDPVRLSCAQCPVQVSKLYGLGAKLLIFGENSEFDSAPYLSDGTVAGTRRIELCNGCIPYDVTITGGSAFVAADGGSIYLFRLDSAGRKVQLMSSPYFIAQFAVSEKGPGRWWIAGAGFKLARLSISDGTRAGTEPLGPRMGTADPGSDPQSQTTLDGGLFFCATEPPDFDWEYAWFARGPYDASRLGGWDCPDSRPLATDTLFLWHDIYGVYRSDGTEQGTYPVREEDGFATVGEPMVLGDLFAHSAATDEGSILLRSDGTSAGTVEIPGVPFAQRPSTAGDAVYFFAQGKMWRTNLTAEGTTVVREPFDFALAGPVQRTATLLLVQGEAQISWLPADGSAGPRPISDEPKLRSHHGLKIHGKWAYFWGRRTAGELRERLARVDLDLLAAGQPAPAETLAEFDRPTDAYRGSFEGKLVPLADGRLAFTARAAEYGEELFVTDGTAAGTNRVSDTYSGALGGVFSDPWPLGGGVVFAAHDGEHGVELWWSDGRENGTYLLEDMQPGLASSFPGGFAAAADRVYFSADDGKIGRELWVVEP